MRRSRARLRHCRSSARAGPNAACSRSRRWACGRSAIACGCRATALRGASNRGCSRCSIARWVVCPIRGRRFAPVNDLPPAAISSRKSPIPRGSATRSSRCSTSCAVSCAERRCGVQALELRLVHREAAPTRVRLRFDAADGRAAHASRSLSANDWRSCQLAAAGARHALAGRRADTARGRIRRTSSRRSRSSRRRRAATRRAPAGAARRRTPSTVFASCRSIVPSPRGGGGAGVAGEAKATASIRSERRNIRRPCSRAVVAARASRSCSTAASSRASRASSSSRRDPSASRAAGGTAATSGAITTSPAIRRACACGCFASVAHDAQALVPAWRVRLSRPRAMLR